MDVCFIDITIEFLSVAFHNILYYANVYPRAIFETRKKYNLVVYYSIHPEVNQYIELCLRSIAVCLKNEHLCRIDFSITDENYERLINFVFDIEKNQYYDDTEDAYLVRAEQNLRAFGLKLASFSDKFKILPENCSFSIFLHTNESAAVSMAVNPDLEDFPFVETEECVKETNRILPIRRFSLRSYNMDTYIEIK